MKTFCTVSANRPSSAPETTSPVPTWTSTVFVSNENEIWPVTKPKMSIVALPLARMTRRSYAIVCAWSAASVTTTASLNVPLSSTSIAFVQSSAVPSTPRAAEPRLTATESDDSVSVRPSMPRNEPPVRSAVSASQDRVSAVSAGFSVATSSVPPVTLKPMPPATPTKTFDTLSDTSVSVASWRSAWPSPVVSTSTCFVSNENPIVPVTKPNTSTVAVPLARSTPRV